MERYYDLSKATPKEIAEDFLAAEEAEKKALDEAVEQAVAEREAEGWECIGVYDAKDFLNEKDEIFEKIVADLD